MSHDKLLPDSKFMVQKQSLILLGQDPGNKFFASPVGTKIKSGVKYLSCFMLNFIWDALNEKEHIRYSTENSISDYRKIINLL